MIGEVSNLIKFIRMQMLFIEMNLILITSLRPDLNGTLFIEFYMLD